MGLYFRKSAVLGPIRLNFSKSGIGVSTGVKGARLVFTPKGTFVHIGRNGLYYRKHISLKEKQNKRDQELIEIPTIRNVEGNQEIIETVNFDNLSDIDSQEFINELELKDSKSSYLNFFIILGIAVFLAFSIFYFIPYAHQKTEGKIAIVKDNVVNIRAKSNINSNKIIQVFKGDKLNVVNDSIKNDWIYVNKGSVNGFIYMPLVDLKTEIISSIPITRFGKNKILVYVLSFILLALWIFSLVKMQHKDKKRKTIEIYYDLDDELNDLYEKFLNSFKSFLSVSQIWQIRTSSSGHDKKYHGGASTLVNRDIITERSLHKLPMKYFVTNASIPFIGLKNIKLFFLPERLLIKKDSRYASIMYKNLKFGSYDSSFVEDGAVPTDSKVIDYTWKFVNKRGGPDKRFSNNKQIPVCKYSNYYLESEQGLNEVIQTSRLDGFKEFEDTINLISNLQSTQITQAELVAYNPKDELSKFLEFLTKRNQFKKTDLQLKLYYSYTKTNKLVDLS
jgi:large-conductance mechanosensitive channel